MKDRLPMRVNWSLLFEWWCVPEDMTPEEEISFLDMLSPAVLVKDRDIIKSRLYGGFQCEDAHRVHVGFDTGAFCYMNPECNTVYHPVERSAKWEELLAANGQFKKIGPFTEDMPERRSDEDRELGGT